MRREAIHEPGAILRLAREEEGDARVVSIDRLSRNARSRLEASLAACERGEEDAA